MLDQLDFFEMVEQVNLSGKLQQLDFSETLEQVDLSGMLEQVDFSETLEPLDLSGTLEQVDLFGMLEQFVDETASRRAAEKVRRRTKIKTIGGLVPETVLRGPPGKSRLCIVYILAFFKCKSSVSNLFLSLIIYIVNI